MFGYDVPYGCTIAHNRTEGITRVYDPQNNQIFWAND